MSLLTHVTWISERPSWRLRILHRDRPRVQLHVAGREEDGGQDLMFVVHVTKDGVKFIQPQTVTDQYVAISISGFSRFGLGRKNESEGPINGMVLLFHQPSDDPELYASLFVLLLPKNASIDQVKRIWKERNGARYIETISDCKLIPNQTYKLSGHPANRVQPKDAEFVNFKEYHNYTPSFKVQLAVDVKVVDLELKYGHTWFQWLPVWLFGSQEPVVWSDNVQLTATPASHTTAGKIISSLGQIHFCSCDFIGNVTNLDFLTAFSRFSEAGAQIIGRETWK
ncbi:uncharacterized protein LOC115363733 [Myripristis murdjan]|uniref:uncharacterized protein LOC115363733 n=1 Tax=Myripristis murdjan TaxID=586833 RepID=UPI0011762C4A|nr:uncharacterized protein LOC115363733 [Myripristis murdjan]